MVKTKVCCYCKEEKPASDFYKTSKSKDGLRGRCKVCHSIKTIKKQDKDGHKTCSKCNQELLLSNFSKAKWGKYGVSSICKSCKKDYNARKYKENAEENRENYKRRYWKDLEKSREQSRQRAKRRREEKPEEVRAYDLAWKKSNRDKCRVYERNFRGRNAHRVRGWSNEYRNRHKSAKPSWAEGEYYDFLFEEIYELRDIRRELTGIDWNVDHVVPLCASSGANTQVACGLHVPWNLSVITAKENYSKNAYSWPNMWDYKNMED